ncbi:MAG: YfcE family phosphodiesterase, partial [Lacrimispora sp.]
PRQEGRRPSYMIMELDDKGEAHFTLNFLGK